MTIKERCTFPGCVFEGTWSELLEHAPEHPIPHPDDRRAWLASRRTFIGASEVPTVCGLNPYAGALRVYAAKISPPVEEDQKKHHTRLGQLFERPLLQDYADRHGVKLRRPATQRDPLVPFIAATPDAESDDGQLVQVKMVGANVVDSWADGLPPYVRLQAQIELAVFGRERGVVLALLGGTDLQEYPIKRDEEIVTFAYELTVRFWKSYIVPRVLPSDLDTVRDASKDLQRIYPRALRQLTMASSDERDKALAYKEVSKQISELDEKKKLLRDELCAMIADREGFTWAKKGDEPQGYATWKASKGETDWKAVAEAALERFCSPQETQDLLAEFTPESGSRRLLVNIKGRR